MLGRSFRTSQWRVRNYFWDLGGECQAREVDASRIGRPAGGAVLPPAKWEMTQTPTQGCGGGSRARALGWVGAQGPCMKISPPRLCRGLNKPSFKEISLHPANHPSPYPPGHFPCSSHAELNPEKPLHTQGCPLSERSNLIKRVMCSGSPHLPVSCSFSQNLSPLLVLLILLPRHTTASPRRTPLIAVTPNQPLTFEPPQCSLPESFPLFSACKPDRRSRA